MPDSALFSYALKGNSSGLLAPPPHKTVIVLEYPVSKGFINNAFPHLKSYWLKSDNQKQPTYQRLDRRS